MAVEYSSGLVVSDSFTFSPWRVLAWLLLAPAWSYDRVMPELPEVECVRLSLERLVVGRRIDVVRVSRPGVITGAKGDKSLLVGDKLSKVIRHGKQLAIVGGGGRCVCVHLGMSGQLCVMDSAAIAIKKRTPGHQCLENEIKSGIHPSTLTSELAVSLPAHTHVLWQLDGGLALRFTDPRRFGGLWTFSDEDELVASRWSKLGPDARLIGPSALARGLSKTQRTLKAALLDQHLIAGLGNIYVDELLFNAKLHPLLPACELEDSQVPGLVRRMRTLLSGAVERGGSSLRDYVDGNGKQGSQQNRHRVYGRAGMACKRRGCQGIIQSEQVAGRTTAWCPSCQPRG